MNEIDYKMIFKRKSFHIFEESNLSISNEERQMIVDEFKVLIPLYKDISVKMEIVDNDDVTCKRKQECCILLYSESDKDNYLQNIGYIGEQLDLYLASIDIGVLWFGIGKTNKENIYGLDFVIMLAIRKVDKDKFRKDMYKSKRKPLEEIWIGKNHLDIGNIVRFAPSACNSQPWIVKSEEKKLTIYRYKKPGKRGIMPVSKVNYYNKIDIGIFILFLEVCLKHYRISYKLEMFVDNFDDDEEEHINAIFYLE